MRGVCLVLVVAVDSEKVAVVVLVDNLCTKCSKPIDGVEYMAVKSSRMVVVARKERAKRYKNVM